MSSSASDLPWNDVKLDVGRRLRFARTNHPNGPMTQTALADATGVSTRALGDIEAGNANPSLETLVKITCGLGVERMAYLLDQEVFDEVNRQFESVTEFDEAKRQLAVTSVSFRADSTPNLQEVTTILQQLQTWVAQQTGDSPRP